MKGKPITDAGFIAHEQGFEAVEPGLGVFDHRASAVKFGVKERIGGGLLIGRAAVTSDVGFDVAGGAGLTQLGGVKGAIGV